MQILGVDAAWTPDRNCGLALLERSGKGRWRCQQLAPSYGVFLGDDMEPKPGRLDAARLLADREIGIVAVGMPLSRVKINGPREADMQVTRAFSKWKCAAITPNSVQPGKLSEQFLKAFKKHGFELQTSSNSPATERSLIEVYPQPALVQLMRGRERIPYKVGKAEEYWPTAENATRIRRVLQHMRDIRAALAKEIADLPDFLPKAQQVRSLAVLRPYEDVLDALVCAWIGTLYEEGKAKAYGDDNAAIWLPDR